MMMTLSEDDVEPPELSEIVKYSIFETVTRRFIGQTNSRSESRTQSEYLNRFFRHTVANIFVIWPVRELICNPIGSL